jgi:hypothetical protein
MGLKYAAITTFPDEPPEMVENFRKHWPIPLYTVNDEELLEKSEILREFHRRCLFPAMTGYVGGRYNYNYDAIRFAWKVFAITTFDEDVDVLFWVDADTHTHADVPMEFVESILPDDCYTAAFNRSNMYTECGFVAYRVSGNVHKLFTRAWETLYQSGDIFALPQWHDCAGYDALCASLSGTHNLSEHDCMHPIINSRFGAYIDHRKGGRKDGGSTSADLVVPREEEYWKGR